MTDLVSMGFQLMGYGLIGVFTVLACFIGMINLIVKIFADK